MTICASFSFCCLASNDLDLPLSFHPAGTGALWVDTPTGAGGATDRCAEFLGDAARLSVAVARSSANALGVWYPRDEWGLSSL